MYEAYADALGRSEYAGLDLESTLRPSVTFRPVYRCNSSSFSSYLKVVGTSHFEIIKPSGWYSRKFLAVQIPWSPHADSNTTNYSLVIKKRTKRRVRWTRTLSFQSGKQQKPTMPESQTQYSGGHRWKTSQEKIWTLPVSERRRRQTYVG